MTKSIIGNETEAFGSDPSQTDKVYKFRYKVVDINDLIPSHSDTLTLNPAYPQELQPRLRDRAASRTQIESIAKNLNPRALLQDSGFIDTGPMIVGSDNVVESGNGRVLALRKAEQDYPQQYARYKAMLDVTAKSLGINKDELAGIKNPVLVRERLTNVDRAKFAAEANVGAVMGMSPYEQALQDSGRLSPSIVGNLSVGEDQTIDQALRMRGNDDIVKHFVSNIPATERATIADEKGSINQQGLERLKLAIFAKTYTGDAGKRLVRIFGESADPQVKSIENAMFASLPDMAKAEGLIDSKQRESNLDIAPDIAEVVDTYAALKARGLSIPDYLKQQAMFEERLTPFQKQLLQHLDDTARKPKLVREMLRDTAQRIIDAPAKGQTGFMGIEPVTKEGLVYGVINKQRAELGEPPLTHPAAVSTVKELEKPDTGGDKSPGRLEPRMEGGRGTSGQMASGTSVQTGLSGFGKETAQVKMFGESNTAAGQGGKKETIVDVEKEKARESAKPLPGQIEMKEKKEVYKYTSPYRPLPMNYLPKDVKFDYDNSTIGEWTPATVYAFDKPIPENQVKQWDLEEVSPITKTAVVKLQKAPEAVKAKIPSEVLKDYPELKKEVEDAAREYSRKRVAEDLERQSKEPYVYKRETHQEPKLQAEAVKKVVMPSHKVSHSVSGDQNAAIHAWYDAHPEKDKEAIALEGKPRISDRLTRISNQKARISAGRTRISPKRQKIGR